MKGDANESSYAAGRERGEIRKKEMSRSTSIFSLALCERKTTIFHSNNNAIRKPLEKRFVIGLS